MGNVSSMTGFASAQSVTRAGTLTLELRSVNSRFLDLHFRMNDDLRSCEPILREKLNKQFSRGKMECRLSWGRGEGARSVPRIDIDLVRKLNDLESQIQAALPRIQTFRTTEILNWPGVVEDTSLSTEELQTEIAQLCNQAIEQMLASRQREGDQLVAVLRQKISDMDTIIEQLEPLVPSFIDAYEAKLRDKVKEKFKDFKVPEEAINQAPNIEERIKQEVALYSVRLDVREEIDRLKAHFSEVNRVLSRGGIIGKRLDFIAQELNRESNTLGSKAHAFAQTQSAIDLKVLIEQIREQIQNIE